MNDLITRLMDFIEQQEKLYFRAVIVVLVLFLFLAAKQFQDLVLFVSLGLLGGALYVRLQGGDKIEIGGFVGACIGVLVYGGYFVISSIPGLF